MAVKVVTSTELGYLRRDGQWSEFFLSIDAPPAVYTARVSATPGSTDKVVSITYTSGSGTLADVKAGMTLAVGTSAGAYDKGLARIRATPDGSHFYVGETSEINWASGDYLTVLDEFGLWPKHIYMQGATPYVDYNVAYSDQHAQFAPVVVGGPDPVAWLSVFNTVDVAFDVSESWVLGGGAITYSWSAPGASATSGSATAAPTFTYTATGRYRVSCVATANSKTTTRYWTVQVYGADRPPVTQFVPSQITGGDDGYSFTVTMYAEATLTTVRDRALVTLFAKDHYGATEISLGPVAGRENIVAWGCIAGETIDYNAELSTVTFEVKPVGYWLQQMPGFPAGFENISGAANAWTNFNRLTLDKALFSTLYYRSTAPLCIDITLTGDTKLAAEFPSPGSTSLWEQLNTFAFQAVMAKPVVDRLGHLYVTVDTNLIPAAERASIPTVMTLTTADWRDKITLARNPTNRCSLVDLSGVQYDGATLTALFALSYGNVYARHGATQRMDRLVLASQAQANELAGLVMAQQNSSYPSISVTLAANNRMLDIAPRQFVQFSLAAADTPRGVTLTDVHLIPKRISYALDPATGTTTPTVEFEIETFPAHAVTGIGPATTPEPPPSTDPPVVGPGGDDTPSDLVYVGLLGGVWRSRDFSAAAPTWAQVGLELYGAEWELILDAYDPRNTAYVSGDYGVWKSANLDSYANFANIHTNTDFAAANTGYALVTVQDIRGTIAAQGQLYCLAIGQDLSSNYAAFVGSSSDGGAIWSWTFLGTTTNATDLHGLAVSQHNAGTVLASAGAGKLYKSTDYGATFTLLYTAGGAPATNIEIPYESNSSDQLVLISTGSTSSGGGTRHMTFSNYQASTYGGTISNLVTSYGDNWMRVAFTVTWPIDYGAVRPMTFDWVASGDYQIGDMLVEKTRWISKPVSLWDSWFPIYGSSGLILAYDPGGNYTYTHEDDGYVSVVTHDVPEYGLRWLSGEGNNRVLEADMRAPDGNRGTYNVEFIYWIYSCNGEIVLEDPLATGHILRSVDGGTNWTDITPTQGSAVGWRGLHSDVLDSDHLTAVVDGDVLVVSSDGGANWTERQTGLTGAVAIGRWPYGSNQGFLLADGKVYWTNDDFVTLVDKTGDLTVTGPRMIIPMWVQ